MDEDTLKRPSPKPSKLVIIYDGERPYYAAYADEAQIKKIIAILAENRRKLAQ